MVIKMIDLFIGFGSIMFLIIALALISFGIWIWALIDCLSSKEIQQKN